MAVEADWHLGDKAQAHTGPPASNADGSDTVLTHREVEVLQLLANGASSSDVAERLLVSKKTTESHVTRIYAKLGATSRTQAVAKAVRLGIVRMPSQGVMTGRFGDDVLRLDGYFQLGLPELADIGGRLCGHRIQAKVSLAEGGLGPVTVVAEGTIGEEPFELFVSLSDDLAQAKVRGLLGGRPVSLDVTGDEASIMRVVGEYSAQHPFLALVVRVVLHFLGALPGVVLLVEEEPVLLRQLLQALPPAAGSKGFSGLDDLDGAKLLPR